MSQHKPDYAEIERLEHECFPEWFADEKKEEKKPAPKELEIKPGQTWQVNGANDAVVQKLPVRPGDELWDYCVTSAYHPASASTGALPHGRSVGPKLRQVKRQVVLPWEPPRS